MQTLGPRRRWPGLPCPSAREAASMYGTAVAVFLVILVAALQGSAPPESPFTYHIPLNPEETLELSWNVNYTQETVNFQLLVRKLQAGVLFGMSDRGEPENADLVVLWTDGDRAYFGYEPIVTAGNEALVHHMEIFQCSATYESFPHFNGPCDSKMKPERLSYCRHVLAAWALGAKAFYYPEEVGLPFGGQGSSRYLRLEVHYHNPLNTQGRRDSSGIRLYYTRSLRRYDAGIMELGLVYTPVMAIPPREPAFTLTGYCTDKCTQLALPPSGIHIFASQLHTHLTGRQVVTVLARDGQEREVVNRDTHYSPHFQEIRMLKKVVTVHQGDVLITSCTYNTEDRQLATVGGFGIEEEMCVNYVHYYPQTQLELCKSTMDAGFLQKYFHLVNSFDSMNICTCPQTSIPQQFASVPWNAFNRDVLKALYGFAPISMHCNKSSAVRFQGEWNLQPLPKITSTLRGPARHCPASRAQRPSGPTVVNVTRGRG
ncbi:dopamine beta-hydroxylase [Echinops telfairi]|uniref:Dopamine beta-hydroxylase n=1 Tax=Echinops telfairi TaxID=9371 RepID=A0AC55D0N2_ECHTE|nr:dopamine beta-hydroxylase [Echinops telfairi]